MRYVLALSLITACVFVGWMAPRLEVALSDEVPLPVAPSPLVVKGPDSCEVGELVRIDATSSQCEYLAWRIIPESPDFEAVDGTRRAMFSSRVPGTFLVVVAGALDNKPNLVVHSITVNGTVPQPNTPPTATKPIDQQIATWFTLVKTEQRKEEAKKLAGVFRTLSSTDLEVNKILEATATANRNTLGKSIDGWVPFLDALGKELDLYIANKQLGTKEQYRDLWVKIAEGLEKAAQ